MLIEIIGGSGSGKSEFAEKYCMELCPGKKYYIATMQPFDEEGKLRVLRHQKLREGKMFVTIECQTGLENVQIEKNATILLECMSNLVANEMYSPEGRYEKLAEETCHVSEETCHVSEEIRDVSEEKCDVSEEIRDVSEEICDALKETCGECREPRMRSNREEVRERMVAGLMQGIRWLADNSANFVIVTNQVFSDGIEYDASTMEYMRILAKVNQEIGAMADEVYELVHGIPITVKTCENM